MLTPEARDEHGDVNGKGVAEMESGLTEGKEEDGTHDGKDSLDKLEREEVRKK